MQVSNKLALKGNIFSEEGNAGEYILLSKPFGRN